MAEMDECCEDNISGAVAATRHMKVMSILARCRVCQKLFCCDKCREKHEEENHNIGPEPLETQIEARKRKWPYISGAMVDCCIEDRHFPLHCIHCKIVILSKAELKCVITTNSICLPEVENSCHMLVMSSSIEQKSERVSLKRKRYNTSDYLEVDATFPSAVSFCRRIHWPKYQSIAVPTYKAEINSSFIKPIKKENLLVRDKFLNDVDSTSKKTPVSNSWKIDYYFPKVSGTGTSTPYYVENVPSSKNIFYETYSKDESLFQCSISPTDLADIKGNSHDTVSTVVQGKRIICPRGIMRKTDGLEFSPEIFNKGIGKKRKRVIFSSDDSSLTPPSCLQETEKTEAECHQQKQNLYQNINEISLSEDCLKHSNDLKSNQTSNVLSSISSACFSAFSGIRASLMRAWSSRNPTDSFPHGEGSSPLIFHFEPSSPQSKAIKKARLSSTPTLKLEHNSSCLASRKPYFDVHGRPSISRMRTSH